MLIRRDRAKREQKDDGYISTEDIAIDNVRANVVLHKTQSPPIVSALVPRFVPDLLSSSSLKVNESISDRPEVKKSG